MANILDPLPVPKALSWVPDTEVTNCMCCNASFTVINRKHHCRQCGNVVCSNCSPKTRKLSSVNSAPVRICNSCYTLVGEDNANASEWAGYGSIDEVSSFEKHPLSNSRMLIGQIRIKVVEAVGLPSLDALSCDPFVRVTLTGRWRNGQRWGSEYISSRHTRYKKRTLHPNWNESFVFQVFAPQAEVLFHVFNYGSLGQPTEFGQASIPLTDLLDQMHHNKWLELSDPSKSSKTPKASHGGRSSVGQLNVHLKYEFSRLAEFLSYFHDQPDYIAEWPMFKAATLYSNFWVLLDDLWPYLEVIWTIVPLLNWDHPSTSMFWFVICCLLLLYIQWLPIVLHIIFLGFLIRNYVRLTFQTFSMESPNSSSNQETNERRSRFYALPPGLHHLTNKMTRVALDGETHLALESVQNNIAWWSGIFLAIESLCFWENGWSTLKLLIAVLLSFFAHLVIHNPYIWIIGVTYLFIRWTIPYKFVMRLIFGITEGIQSLYRQYRCTVESTSHRTVSKKRRFVESKDTNEKSSEETATSLSRQNRPNIRKRMPVKYQNRSTKSSFPGSGISNHSDVKGELLDAAVNALSNAFPDERG